MINYLQSWKFGIYSCTTGKRQVKTHWAATAHRSLGWGSNPRHLLLHRLKWLTLSKSNTSTLSPCACREAVGFCPPQSFLRPRSSDQPQAGKSSPPALLHLSTQFKSNRKCSTGTQTKAHGMRASSKCHWQNSSRKRLDCSYPGHVHLAVNSSISVLVREGGFLIWSFVRRKQVSLTSLVFC